MIINFRQGIVKTQTSPSFLTLSGNNVHLNCDSSDTIITFSHDSTNYIFKESKTILNAWTAPFISGTNYWLYWNIDLFTGIRTFGYTTIDPTGFGSTLPTNPTVDQHFFNMKTKTMVVWNGSKWVDVLRVFAGKVSSGGILIPNIVESQVNLNGPISAGFLLFTSEGIPIKAADTFGKGKFITTETFLSSQDDLVNLYKIETSNYPYKAIETIPKFHAIAMKDYGYIGVASSEFPEFPCIGIATEDIQKDEIKQFCTGDIITNYNNWNFTDAPGTPIWVNGTGEITTSMPKNTSAQKIGHVVSSDTVFIDISDTYLIDPII